MLMETFKTNEEALRKELWDATEHCETMGLITADQAADIWCSNWGMEWLNPKPDDTVYYCDICGNEFDHELKTKDARNYCCDKCFLNEL